MDEGFGADVLWHEIGALSQAVAGAFDLHDDGVVQQSVEQGGVSCCRFGGHAPQAQAAFCLHFMGACYTMADSVSDEIAKPLISDAARSAANKLAR